jgi:hypothetical protein
MKQEAAETIALQALGWLAKEEDLLPGFLTWSGTSLDEVRARAGDADFLAAVVDFLLQEDRWVLAFSDFANLAPSSIMEARAALPGGATLHWT